MRTRWTAAIVGVSTLALAAAVSLAQWPKSGPRASTNQPKTWRTPGEPPQGKSEPAADDPMTAVDAFLERNRKEAGDSIKTLTDEAEALRARLAKVEAALDRWQNVAQALATPKEPANGVLLAPGTVEAKNPEPVKNPVEPSIIVETPSPVPTLPEPR